MKNREEKLNTHELPTEEAAAVNTLVDDEQEVNTSENVQNQNHFEEPVRAKTPVELAKENFNERQIEEPKHKNSWLGNLFFVAVLVLSLLLMWQLSRNAANGSEKTLAEILQNVRWNYFLYAIGTLILMIFLDSLKYSVILSATTSKHKYAMALKTGLLGKYYDYITPFSSGGQPFQIHYLHKKGLTGGESTAVIFIKFCFNMIMWLTICFCLMVFNHNALVTYVSDASQRGWFTVLGWIGFGVNAAIPLLIIAFAVFPRLMEGLARGVLTVGKKLHLVKDQDATVLKAKRISKDFRSAFIIMIHKPFHAILLILLCLCEPFLGMVLPYFVVVALAGEAIVPSYELMFAIMTLNVYVSMSVTIVPTPGNSGAMENAFLLILTTVAEGVLFWSVFTWRFLSYYTYVIIGMIILISDFVRKRREA